MPLAADLLPGWDVVAFVPAVATDSAGRGGFLLIGSLLVGIFLAAIVAGGSLLFWQARRSEGEAAQKTSFVANVSHEFKTPLTTIRLYSELLESGRVRDAAQSGEYLRTISRETQRLARLVGNALDFSRLEQGHKKYARESLDLRAELARLLDTQEPRLAEVGLALRRDLPAGPLMVTSDRDALEQIVLNLLDNAAKYGAAGGEVTVELAARRGGGAAVRVLDRGPGVPVGAPRTASSKKFHRVDDTLHRGEGRRRSRTEHRAAARARLGRRIALPREGGGASFAMKARILIAEDDANIRLGLIATLESDGYAVTAAGDGAQALKLFPQGKFDLVLLDVMMPQQSGYDVCRALRAGGRPCPSCC